MTTGDLTPTGNCYQWVIHQTLFVPTPAEGFKYGTIVHGRPTLQREPFIPYGHAWIETGELCWHEKTEGPIPKALYYALGRIDPDECFRYTYEEARQRLAEFGHYGPWDGPHGCSPIDQAVMEE